MGEKTKLEPACWSFAPFIKCVCIYVCMYVQTDRQTHTHNTENTGTPKVNKIKS